MKRIAGRRRADLQRLMSLNLANLQLLGPLLQEGERAFVIASGDSLAKTCGSARSTPTRSSA